MQEFGYKKKNHLHDWRVSLFTPDPHSLTLPVTWDPERIVHGVKECN